MRSKTVRYRAWLEAELRKAEAELASLLQEKAMMDAAALSA